MWQRELFDGRTNAAAEFWLNFGNSGRAGVYEQDRQELQLGTKQIVDLADSAKWSRAEAIPNSASVRRWTRETLVDEEYVKFMYVGIRAVTLLLGVDQFGEGNLVRAHYGEKC